MSAPASTQAAARSSAALSPSLASASVRAMMTKLWVGARVDGRLDAIDHLFARDDLLAGAVAATLGLHLVFDVTARGAGLGERADGARNIESAAEAGVRIDQQRQRANVGDAAHVGEHIVECRDTEVRHAERSGRNAAARKIDGAVAGALRHARVVGVDGADDLQRLLSFDGFAEFCT